MGLRNLPKENGELERFYLRSKIATEATGNHACPEISPVIAVELEIWLLLPQRVPQINGNARVPCLRQRYPNDVRDQVLHLALVVEILMGRVNLPLETTLRTQGIGDHRNHSHLFRALMVANM